MAKVVYTAIDSLEELPNAKWETGDQDSYENTQRYAAVPWRYIALVGRMDRSGNVSLCYAKSDKTLWVNVNDFNITLAKYFAAQLGAAHDGTVPSINVIQDAQVEYALRQLVSADVGSNASTEPFGEQHKAINRINETLRAFNLPATAWSFIPMRNTLQRQTQPV